MPERANIRQTDHAIRAITFAALLLMGSGSAAMAADGSEPLIQIRPVVDCASNPEAPHLSIYSTQAHCLGDAVITEKDFVRLERKANGPLTLRAKLTPEAQAKFYRATLVHVFQPWAMLVLGRPTQVLTMDFPESSSWLLISDGDVTNAELNEVANRYYAQGGRD